MIKRILSILIAVSMVTIASVSTTAFASESSKNETLSMDANQIFSNKELSSITNLIKNWLSVDSNISDYGNIEIGNKIPVYEYSNDTLIRFLNVKYYPVFSNNEAIGILGIHGDPNDPTYSFGEEWASEVNTYIGNGSTEFCIVVTENQMFIKSIEDASLIEDYLFANEGSQITRSMTATIEDSIASMNSNIEYYSSQEKYDIQIPKETRSAIQLLLPVGTMKQSRNYCWAITVKFVGEYIKKDVSNTPEQICDTMKIDYDSGADILQSQDALYKIYTVSTTSKPELTPNEVYAAMNKSKPCYTSWQSTSFGHGMTLCGYYGDSDSNEYEIRLSDSNSGTYKWLAKSGGPSSQLRYQYTYGPNTYNWSKTLVP